MTSPDISTDARTVTHLAVYFEELKQAALDLADRFGVQERGYFTPSEEDQARALLVSYWQSRCALLELITSIRHEVQQSEQDQPAAFLIAMAAAVILVDAARFLREQFNDRAVVRRKLNEPAPQFGIPPGTYDRVQRSLVGARHAWHLYHAKCYFEENESQLRDLAAANELAPVMRIIDRLRDRLDVTITRLVRTRSRVRAGQMVRRLARNLVGRALYGLQKLGMSMMADVYVRPGHQPRIPADVERRLRLLLAPGDVLVVRKEYALTNYFLPGYWPHAALVLGDAEQIGQLGIVGHRHVRPRWNKFVDAGPDGPWRVLESMKDGVQIRPLSSPLGCDSLVVLRPQLSTGEVAQALARGMAHEGKPYDFDFNFARSDRLVCTEVVYRSYEGIGQMRFSLAGRAGRPTLSGSDLIGMAVRREHFAPIAVFAPQFAPALLTGPPADEVLRRASES